MAGDTPYVDEVGPAEAWKILESATNSELVDVRTTVEWSFVGVPDLAALGKTTKLVEWAAFPGMTPNPQFADQLQAALGNSTPSQLLFICRSGARSMAAAQLVAQTLAARGAAVQCTNVADGFEGPLDDKRQRGNVGGWQATGLPWVQS